MTDHDYPEHEKLAKVSSQSQTLGDFLEWASAEQGWHLAKWEDDGRLMWPLGLTITTVLATYFDIDLTVLEAEKRQMLDEIRAAGARHAERTSS